MPTLDFYEDDAGEWRARLQANNGQVVHASEGYTSRADAERGWHDLVANVQAATWGPDQETLPEAHSTEDGDTWWMEGHHAPAIVVLGMVLEQAYLCGARTALQLLTNTIELRVDPHEGYLVSDYQAARKAVAELLENVSHVWIRQLDDGERIEYVEPGDEGAEPWSRLNV